MKKMAKEIERLTNKSQALQATADARTTQVKELGNRNRTLQRMVQQLGHQLLTQQKAASELEAGCKQLEARLGVNNCNPRPCNADY